MVANDLRYQRVPTCKECMQRQAHCGTGKACEPARAKLRNYTGIRITSDGFDCAMPLAIDSHTVCSYGCNYCFADNLVQHRANAARKIGQTSLRQIETLFSGKGRGNYTLWRKAMRYDKRNKNGYPGPCQVGAITDPLDNIERQQGWFLKFAEIVKKYDQPVRISTKGNLFLEDEYLEALAEKPHLFRVHYSIISPDDELLPKIDKRAPPPSERIECMRQLEKIGVETCLRFRPILPGLSDSTPNHPEAYKDLIDMAWKAGCRNISYEAGFVPGMMTADLRRRWKEIEEICGLPLIKIYKQFGKTQACTRASYQWVEAIMHAIYDHAKKREMTVGVSDPLWKQLTDYGCCCAIAPDHPVFGNWQREQATEAFVRARDDGIEVCSKDVIPDWAHEAQLTGIVNPGPGPLVRYGSKHNTWADKLYSIWTKLKMERSPLNYFQGALMPTRRTKDGDVFFKYQGLQRRHPKHTPYWKVKQ